MTEENTNHSESASELNELKEMVRQVQSSVGYVTALLETLVDQLKLSHKSNSDAQMLMQMNSELMTSLFSGKDFQGKEKFMEFLTKIQSIGAKQ